MNSPIISDTHIENIDSEITWVQWKDIPSNIESLDQYFYAFLTLSNWYKIQVYFNDESLYELLEEKFHIERYNNWNNPEWTIFFDSAHKDRAFWIFDDTKNQAYVVWDGFWIFKSAISGLATLLWSNGETCLPVHGSAIHSSQIGGVSLIGAHRVWKTTWLLNMSHLLWEWNVISDDWLLANFSETRMSVTTTDNSISLSTKTVEENPHIPQINTNRVLRDVNRRKISYKPWKLLWPNFSNQKPEIWIDTIVLLVTWIKQAITEIWDNLTNIPEFITWATYHFPYYRQDLKKDHENRWRDGLRRTEPRVIVFDHTHFESMIESYSVLINTLIKWKI